MSADLCDVWTVFEVLKLCGKSRAMHDVISVHTRNVLGATQFKSSVEGGYQTLAWEVDRSDARIEPGKLRGYGSASIA